MQRANLLPARKRRVSRTGVFQGLIACQLDNRIQARVDSRDSLEVRLDNLF
jgi:hypothetical protein